MFEESLRVARRRRLGNTGVQVQCLAQLGRALAAVGKFEDASSFFAEALNMAGSELARGFVLSVLGVATVEHGKQNLEESASILSRVLNSSHPGF